MHATLFFQKETCTIPLGFQLNPGQNIAVEMNYIGQLNDLMKGFYRNTYDKGNWKV